LAGGNLKNCRILQIVLQLANGIWPAPRPSASAPGWRCWNGSAAGLSLDQNDPFGVS